MTTAETPPALIGALIDGRYRVDALVGEGGFGTVYAAFHVGLGARVALKVPRVDDLPPAAIAEEVAAFLDEGRTLKRLRHPAVVAALDVGLLPPGADGVALPYLVLEWCDGPTLKEWLAGEPRRSVDADARRIPTAEAWPLLRPIVEALAHAHAEGIVHRDVKPANVIVARARDGRLTPRLIDFGIAKRVGPRTDVPSGATITLSERRAFTPRYAAPEQLTGLRSGPPTDVYALALVLIEVLRGHPVFATDDDARRAVAESEAPTPRALGIAPGPWCDALQRALAVRAGDRYPDAGALLRALDEAHRAEGGRSEGSAEAREGWGGAGATGPREDARAELERAEGSRGERERGDREGADGTRIRPRAEVDDTVMPSSHTARTLSAAMDRAPPRRGVRGLLVGGVAAAGVVAMVAAVAATWRADDDRRADAESEPSASGSASGSASAPIRELASLTGPELLGRASAAGLTGCQFIDAAPVVSVVCGGAAIIARDDGSSVGTLEEARTNLGHQARSYARLYGAARFTTGGDRGLLVSSSPARIDELTRHVLQGVRHEIVADPEVTDMPAVSPPPPRLAAWTARHVARQLQTVGADISHEAWSRGPPSVAFVVGTEPGSTMLIDGDVDAWLAGMKDNRTPFAYAVDGKRLLVSFGTGKTGKVPFLRELLGASQAERFGEGP